MKIIPISLLFCCALFCDETAPISTLHEIEIPSGVLSYTATSGSLPSYDEKRGEILGQIAYTAYTLNDSGSERPITFIFNGGPGASSIFLHALALAPRRALSPFEGQSAVAPYKIVDNQSTLLDLSDLVFIDPMSTGFSRPAKEKEPNTFYHSENDALYLSEFVRDYLTLNGRWNSPKYLAGESYGTFRACKMADYLQSLYGIYLNGILLISAALEYQTLIYDHDNPLPYFLFLPTYAATAWVHGLSHVGKTLDEVITEARDFAYNRAAPYYLQPYRYTRDQKIALWRDLSNLTGLSFDEIEEEMGKFTEETFFTKLLFRKIVGRYDTTVLGDVGPNKKRFDPSGLFIEGSMTALFNNYLTEELGLQMTHPPYETFSEESFHQWQYPRNHYFGYPTALNSLRSALITNPALKVYIGNGYYDAATPFAATEHSVASLDLPESYQSNFQMDYYEGGHMYYLHPHALLKFKRDLIKFYKKSQN